MYSGLAQARPESCNISAIICSVQDVYRKSHARNFKNQVLSPYIGLVTCARRDGAYSAFDTSLPLFLILLLLAGDIRPCVV